MLQLVIYLLIAVGVSFICSILEAVLLSITPSYAESLNKERPRAGATIAEVRSKLDQSLSAILILNTFAHTIGAAGVGSQALQIFGPDYETLIAVLLTLVILYFSEIIPKTLGATFWRTLAVPSCWTILMLIKLVYPLVWFASLITKLFSSSKEHTISREEIMALAALSHKGGILGDEENQYLENLFRLRDIPTKSVLTPRSVVHMLHKDCTIDEALSEANSKRFSRIPIYDENADDINSLVLIKDLYEAQRQGRGNDTVESLASPIEVISEKLPVYKLLDLSIKRQTHMFLVQDNYGQTTGIVTLEDAIETLLGREIVDESDAVADMQALAKEKYRDRLRDQKD